MDYAGFVVPIVSLPQKNFISHQPNLIFQTARPRPFYCSRLRRLSLAETSWMHVPATSEIVEWTSYGYKHSPSKNLAWEDIVSSTRYGPAKYKPGINIEKLEREAYKNGVPSTHAKPWKLREYPQVIGASDGKPSYWVRIESSAGVIHGHPVSEQEFRRLTS
ncbi:MULTISPECIES: hypothetical protein [unclassified Pseudomonas]|uniref:hypothetical protein n=1 Tax=unclassified Pseudomonas TaxID=196821 RepID=UPI00159FDFDC|nr:hypothetical protein [Pseudomonas sp. D4002]NWB22975.1 hypothetical protein [Pseudomonas sp. D4002]